MDFIRAVSWSAQNTESCWSQVHITLIVENINFHVFYEVWLTARFEVFFKLLNVTKTINIFSCSFPLFVKASNLFNATAHQVCSPTPTEICIDIILLDIGCILSISPYWPLHTYPSSLQCNFCIPDCLVPVVLWLCYVVQLRSVFPQPIFQVEHHILMDEINVKSLILRVLLA